MRRLLLPALAILATAGCMRPSAVTRGAHAIQRKISPAARAFTNGTRRLVQYAGQSADDATLAAKVKAALFIQKGREGGDIHVTVEEGVVRLTGHVASPARKRMADEAARGTAGIAGVRNRLTVSPAAISSAE